MSETVKETSGVKTEMIKNVAVVCVLCGEVGHMGKDCKEVVCILCCARGHLMEECGDIIIEESTVDVKVPDVLVGEPTSGSMSQKPAIRLKNLNDLIDNDVDDGKVVSLEEEVSTPKAVPTTLQQKSRKVSDDDDKKFQISMTRMFGKMTPPDVIALFKRKYCGLCCIKFSCEKFAKKHYDGRGHESLIRKKTFRNRPMSWQMIFHALISVDPEGATEDDIFEYISETFSAHIGHDLEKVRDEMVATLGDMVGRFHNVVESGGVYRLRDRKPGDAPKPVPNGLVEKKKCVEDEGDLKPTNSRFHSSQRHVDSRHKERNSGKNRSSIKHLEKIVDIERTRTRDLKDDLDRDRRYRRDRKSRRERDRSKSRDSRLRLYRERSRSRSRSRDYRRSRSHRSRSRHRRPGSSPAGAIHHLEKAKTSLIFSDRRSERFTAHRSTQVQVKTEPNINPNFSLPHLNQDYYPPVQQVVAPYQPYFMTTPPETFSSLIAGLLTAAQTPQGLTPPPTPEEF